MTHRALRSSAWRRLFRGVYADRSLADTHRLRCHAAAAFVLPKSASIAGRSAATLYGVGLAEAADPVEVVVAPAQRFGLQQGLLIHTSELLANDVRMLGELAVTDPVRTCWDLAQWLEVAEAVVLIDRMLGAGLVRRSELDAYAQLRKGDRGWRRFGRAVGLADPGRAPRRRPGCVSGWRCVASLRPKSSTRCTPRSASWLASTWPGRN